MKAGGLRVSMHPGQYTVLNSPREKVARTARKDFIYHGSFLDALELDMTHKIILHTGGVHGSKEEAMNLFLRRFAKCR